MVISKDLREIHNPVKTWPVSFPLDPRQALGDPLHNDQAVTDHLPVTSCHLQRHLCPQRLSIARASKKEGEQ